MATVSERATPGEPPELAGLRRPITIAEALARVGAQAARAAILVEGWSDEAAIVALARRSCVCLADAGVIVLPLGGVTNFSGFASALHQQVPACKLAGLYDASEESLALRALERIGLVQRAARADAQAAGYFACEEDLEDELIRAVGADAVQGIVARENELASLRRFQAQPEHRGQALHAQIKRFLGTRAGRKIRYGTLLVEALAPDRVPVVLQRVLAHALDGSRTGAPSNA